MAILTPIHKSTDLDQQAARIQRFLNGVDAVGDRFGINVPAIVHLDYLRHLPVGTLGRSLADFLAAQQIQPFTTGPRRKQLHDSVHVLTGYGTDPVGEAEVQAFLLGAKFHWAHVILGTSFLIMIQRRCPPQPDLWSRLWMAYQRGQQSTFDADRWKIEGQWELPLAQVQSLYQIKSQNKF
jgi:ubiquinone biosynthesis protein Coq4